jgi:mono/diheme cytochrome c family protein
VTERAIKWTAAILAAVAAAAIAGMTRPLAAQQPAAGSDQAQIDPGKIDLGRIDSGRIDLGKSTYAQKCSHCHGPNMVNAGTVTPDLRAFPNDRTRFVTTVKQGKNGRMPPWGDILSDDQVADIWAYVSSRRNP